MGEPKPALARGRRAREHVRVNRLSVRCLVLGCLLVLVAGCASGEAYQKDDAYYEGYGGAQPTSRSTDAPQAMAESDDGGGGFFDFSGVSVQGMFGSPSGAEVRPRERVAQAPPAPPRTPPPAEPAPEEAPAVADDRAPQKRLLIYTGDYTLMVANVDESVKALIALAEKFGGYLGSRQDGVVSVRVPAERFFELTKELPAFGTITGESVHARDVTAQFVDLQLRLQTAERSRARLLELLSQATKMEDILAIEKELRRLTEEIETMKGELRLLSDQIAFSTLTVRFYANAPPPSPYPQRKMSRFPWINAVGIERVLYDF